VIGATVPCWESATAASLGDLGLRRGGVDHEDQRLAGPLAQIDRGADGAQIMRARPGRDDNQFGDRDHRLDGHGDRRRRIDDRQAEALLAQDRKVAGQARHRRLGESGELVLAFVPPIGQRALRIDVDQHDGTGAGPLGLDGEMSGQGRLARSALL
jgi:hypothetical protein